MNSIVLLFSIILLLIFFIILSKIVFNSQIIGYDYQDIQCPIGNCATDINTGMKSCPEDVTKGIIINPSFQVCNPPGTCLNDKGPRFAMQSDGSSIVGKCEGNIECPCVSNKICSRSTMSALGVNFYDLLDTVTDNIVISGEFLCEKGVNILNKCPKQESLITGDELITCMGFDSGCLAGFNGSACYRGILAIKTNNPSSVNSLNVNSFNVACVTGEPCPCGSLTVYDENSESIVCN